MVHWACLAKYILHRTGYAELHGRALAIACIIPLLLFFVRIASNPVRWGLCLERTRCKRKPVSYLLLRFFSCPSSPIRLPPLVKSSVCLKPLILPVVSLVNSTIKKGKIIIKKREQNLVIEIIITSYDIILSAIVLFLSVLYCTPMSPFWNV